MPLTDVDRRFAARAVRRKRLFPVLSAASVAVAVGLVAWIVWTRLHHPAAPIGPRVVLVVLILLNARQNLRQYRYVRILETVDLDPAPPPPGG